jgi:hypothetical protein
MFHLCPEGVRDRTGVWVCRFNFESARSLSQIEVTSLYGHNLAALVVITAPLASDTFNPTASNSSVLEMTLHNLAISGFVERRVAMACSAAVTSEVEYKARIPD